MSILLIILILFCLQMEQLCSNVVSKADRRRLACCSQSNGGVVFLKNVQIKGGKLVFFNDQATALTNLDGSARIPHRLPPIPSVVRRKNMPFNMPVEHKNYSFVNAKCKSYFNGTLHVTGRSTTQNLYHARKYRHIFVGRSLSYPFICILWMRFL